MKNFDYLKAFYSPFKRPKLKWYFGKVVIGTPYFLPRKTIKNPDKPGYLKFIPKKIGFDFVGLGWKTKWNSTDYRFEWAPVWSFVFFGKQIAVSFIAPEQDHYWEAWLYYIYNTTGTRKERIAKCRTEFPLKWTVSDKNSEQSVDYYDLILKRKYK
jgi:hypothetical protein